MRSKLILVLALLMGGVTTFFFYQYVDQYDAQTLNEEEMVQIVAARHSIEKNQQLTREMLQMVYVPQLAVHATTLRTMEEAEGQFVTVNMENGEPILAHRLLYENEETMYVSRKVQEGFRAVSVGLNMVRSVTQLIEPEDNVDVIFTEYLRSTDDRRNAANQNETDTADTSNLASENIIYTEILLEEVRMLAVGRRFVERQTEESFVEYSAVTLELTPEDAANFHDEGHC